MKTTKTPKISKSILPGGKPSLTLKDYPARQYKKDDGSNESLHDANLLNLTNLLMANYATFDKSDFTKLAASYDIEYDDLSKFFDSWAHSQVENKKLSLIQGCYDKPIYKRVYGGVQNQTRNIEAYSAAPAGQLLTKWR